MEDNQWAMFTHAMDFFQEWASLKKSILEHFFTNLSKDLSMEELVTFGNFLSTEFMEPSKWLYATIGRQPWVPQDLNNKVIKQSMNRQMIGSPPKPRDVYNSRKKNVPTIEWKTKIPILAVIYGSIDFLIWITVEIEHRSCLLKNLEKSLFL